ncbi:MAG: RNA polymerase sigma factor [Alphaproteobacteria bacterium]|nr:RNA polymerase sigma factor [Alphaproteobacteria bacterium]
MQGSTDEALMTAYVQRGDRAAFQALFDRYAGRLVSMFRRAGLSDPIAQDMLQTTFLHVHRARQDFRLDGRVRPWLFAIAMNVKREHFRRAQRKPEVALDPDHHRQPSVAPETSTATDRLVRRALAELPDSQREVILLHWYEELSFPEIAEIVGASHAAVKVRAHRGYERLRAMLDPRRADGTDTPDGDR